MGVCRSIKTLRPPYTDAVTDEEVRAAALQYVRKVAGMRSPSAANVEAFEGAVRDVAAVTERLLDSLVLRQPHQKAAATTE
jgi:hypothetical protein